MDSSNQNIFYSLFPEENLPECWKDEKRLNVLYAPFRNREVNPHDYETKLCAWKNLICLYCRHNKIFSFTFPQLQRVLNHKGRSPGGLLVVLQEMEKQGDLKPLEYFMQKPAENWTGWAKDMLKKPIKWSVSKIRDSLVSSDTEINYVNLSVIESESQKLVDLIPDNYNDKVIDMKQLLEIMPDNKCSNENMQLLLHNLQCHGKVALYEWKSNVQSADHQTLLIKFNGGKKSKSITSSDRDIYTLERTEKILVLEIEKMETQASNIILETKAYLAKGHRQMAKNCLRKKHDLDKRLLKRSDALHNVQTLLSRVHDANTDLEVLGSYNTALSALRNTFKDTNLSEDVVTDTMLEIGDVLDIHDDIQTSLAQPVRDEDLEIEQELADLMSSEDGGGPKDQFTELEEQMSKLKLPETPPKNVVSLEKSKVSL